MKDKSISKNIVCILLCLIIAACSAFRSSKQDIEINTSVDKTKIWVNGEYIGESPVKTQVRRDSEVSILAKKEGYEPQMRYIGNHFNTTGVLDMLGTPIIGLPVIGVVSPGARSIDEDNVFIQMQEKTGDAEKKLDVRLSAEFNIDVDTNILEGEIAGRYDVAVIIGNRHYSASGMPDVEFADRDAKIMKEYLIKTFCYDPANIIYIEDATFAKFNEIFGSDRSPKGMLSNRIKDSISKVFIYYVGHGAPDLENKNAYFVPVDANPQYLASSGYKLQTFYNNISSIPVKQATIVIDACFSGNSEKGTLFKNISPVVLQVKKEYSLPDNAVLFASAAIDQVSAWYPEKKHSLFTYYFLKGLQGDADANKNKEISAKEMQAYLSDNVPYMARKLSGLEQQPVVQGDENEVLVRFK